MALKTTKWDIQDYLKTDEAIAAYLEAAAEDGDPKLMARALGDAARARGMSDVARQTGLSREGLYKALSPQGNPSFDTIAKIVAAFQMKVVFASTSKNVERRIAKADKALARVFGKIERRGRGKAARA